MCAVPSKVDEAAAKNVRNTMTDVRLDTKGPMAMPGQRGLMLAEVVYDTSTGSVDY